MSDNQITVCALITFHNRQFTCTIHIGHKTTYFRFISAHKQTQPIGFFIPVLQRIPTHRTYFLIGYCVFFFIPLPTQNYTLIIFLNFQKKWRRVLFRSDKKHSVFCSCHSHIEQSSFFCIFHRTVFSDHKR